MKVSLIGPVYPYRGGIAHYTTLLIREIAKSSQNQIQVISYSRQYPGFLYPGHSDKDPSQPFIEVEASYLLDPIYPWTWRNTSKIISEFDPQIIVIQWWTTFWAPACAMVAWLQRRMKRKIVYLIHNVYPHEMRFWDRALAYLALKQGNNFIVQSESQREELLELIPTAAVELSPHPIYDMYTEARIPKAQARERLGLPMDAFVLLFFGIVRRYKGLMTLLEAMALLRQQGLKPTLIIAGEFWQDKQAVLTFIERNHLEEQILIDDRYIPNERIGSIFSAADLFVAPYHEGTQSGAVMLALGMDLPILITSSIFDESLLSISPERVFSVPPKDSKAIADMITQVIQYIETHDKKESQASKNTDQDLYPDLLNWGSTAHILERLSQETP